MSFLFQTRRPGLSPNPRLSQRFFSSLTSQQHRANRAIIWSCIAGSVAVFGAWNYSMGAWGPGSAGMSSRSSPRGTVVSSWSTTRVRKYLDDNFTLKVSDFDTGRYWTLLGSAISHISFYHILGNMFSLHAFGSYCSVVIPPAALATLLAGSAIGGGISWLYHQKTSGSGRNVRAMGASGMVMGLGSAAACLMPQARVLLFAVVPVPLWILVPAYFVYDAYYLNAVDSRVAHAGHIGGSIFGVVYYALVLRRFGGILGPRRF